MYYKPISNVEISCNILYAVFRKVECYNYIPNRQRLRYFSPSYLGHLPGATTYRYIGSRRYVVLHGLHFSIAERYSQNAFIYIHAYIEIKYYRFEQARVDIAQRVNCTFMQCYTFVNRIVYKTILHSNCVFWLAQVSYTQTILYRCPDRSVSAYRFFFLLFCTGSALKGNQTLPSHDHK